MSLSVPEPVTGRGAGQPGHFTLPGSGLSVPAGLEAIFIYNSLWMNVQKNVDRYRITGIDGLHDADIRDARDSLSDNDGEVPYNAYYGGRTLTISGTIDTYSIAKLRDMQQALRAAFSNIRTEMPLYFNTGNIASDHYINCKKTGSISMTEAQTNAAVDRDFQITVRASNPRFLSAQQNFLDQSYAAPVTEPTLLGVAHNRGTYDAQPVIRVYGPSSGATLKNSTTNQAFTITGIGTGDWLEFDLSKPSPTLVNAVGDNAWMWLADDSEYMYLAGDVNGVDNSIMYSGDASRVTVTWHDSWI